MDKLNFYLSSFSGKKKRFFAFGFERQAQLVFRENIKGFWSLTFTTALKFYC